MENLKTAVVYTPRAILNIFNNALKVSEERILMDIKGVYTPGNNTEYKGYFYDLISEEGSESSLTLVVPALYRQRMHPGKVVELKGFISRRLDTSGNIRISINLVDLLKEGDNKFTEFEVKAIEIQRAKANVGFRNIDSFLQNAIILNKPVRIVIIIGTTSIIDKDILHAMEGTIGYFQPKFLRVNINSLSEILNAFSRISNASDVVIISRGGGENLEVFNNLDLARESLKLKPFLLTAIGHTHDVSLLDKVADKSFITPTSLGNYLKEIYNQANTQAENSRAIMADRIESQLKKIYELQIEALNKSSVEKQKELERTFDLLVSERKRNRVNSIIFILLMILLSAVLLAFLLK